MLSFLQHQSDYNFHFVSSGRSFCLWSKTTQNAVSKNKLSRFIGLVLQASRIARSTIFAQNESAVLRIPEKNSAHAHTEFPVLNGRGEETSNLIFCAWPSSLFPPPSAFIQTAVDDPRALFYRAWIVVQDSWVL